MSKLVSSDQTADRQHRSSLQWSNVFGIAMFAIACSLAVFFTYAYRHIPGGENPVAEANRDGLKAFHNQVYYPVRALVTGENPYSPDYIDYHPDSALGNRIAMNPVPPSTLLILSPLAFFQLHAAEIVFIVVCLLATVGVAWLLLRAAIDYPASLGGTLLTAALMIACLPGINAFVTFPTIMLTLLGVVLAIDNGGRNDLLSGIGIVIAFCQPVVGFAMLILLLFRRNFTAVAFGILMFAVLNIVTIAWIANNAGGTAQVIQDARSVYSNFYSPVVPENVLTSTDRVDAWSAVARIFPQSTTDERFFNLRLILTVGTLLLALVAMSAERDATQRTGVISRSGMLIALVTILYFHQTTSALYLLWIPVIGLLIDGWRSERAFSLPMRFVLGLLVVLPLFNYFVTPFAMGRLGISSTGSALKDAAGDATGLISLRSLLESWELVNPDLAQWQIVVTINTVLIAVAVVIIALRMIFSSLIDRKIIELQNAESV